MTYHENTDLPKAAVYYIDTGKQLPDFLADKPVKCDKKAFFMGDWKKAWPRDYEVYREGE
jgi:hypothetical protein